MSSYLVEISTTCKPQLLTHLQLNPMLANPAKLTPAEAAKHAAPIGIKTTAMPKKTAETCMS